jgi:hypothetical protein
MQYVTHFEVRQMSGCRDRLFPTLVTNEEEDLSRVCVGCEIGHTKFIIAICLRIEYHCFLSFNAELPR